jgi:hypothetical protein
VDRDGILDDVVYDKHGRLRFVEGYYLAPQSARDLAMKKYMGTHTTARDIANESFGDLYEQRNFQEKANVLSIWTRFFNSFMKSEPNLKEKDAINGMVRMRLRILMYPEFVKILCQMAKIKGVNTPDDVREAMKHSASKKMITMAARGAIKNAEIRGKFTPRLFAILNEIVGPLLAEARKDVMKQSKKQLIPRYKFVEGYKPKGHTDYWGKKNVPRGNERGFWGDLQTDKALAQNVGAKIQWYKSGNEPKTRAGWAPKKGETYYVQDAFEQPGLIGYGYNNLLEMPASASSSSSSSSRGAVKAEEEDDEEIRVGVENLFR